MKTNRFVAMMLFFYAGFAGAEGKQADGFVDIVVHRSPSCTCCGKWVDHLKNSNFKVEDIVSDNVQAVKSKYEIPQKLASCHTALVKGYVVEGHVPADDIKTLIKTKPDIVGITVPGMPTGTPGMEMGGKKETYQVISFDKNKQMQVFNTYKAD